LKVESSINAPDTFELLIELDGLEADCEVVWRCARDVGVQFTAPPKRVAPKRKQVVDPFVPAKRPSLRRKPIKA